MKPFISIIDAFEVSKNTKDVLFIDTRFDLTDKPKGQNEYNQGHIPNSLFFDLERDLSSPKTEHSGRHPLVQLSQFKNLLQDNAITKSDHIICYDDASGGYAARLWYMLCTIGFEKVQILEGGFSYWKDHNYPVIANKTVRPQAKTTIDVPENWENGKIAIVNYEQVKDLVENNFSGLIDSRDPDRFRGLIVTYDPIAGHIPGASNRWWKANLSEDGTLRDYKELKKEFDLLFLNNKPDEAVIYCGSGVTTCFNYAVMKELGFSDPKLYIGSFSDWIAHTDETEK